MLLYKKGGSLDTVDNEGFTPVAFGSPKLLSFLSLEKGITLINKPQLPKEKPSSRFQERAPMIQEIGNNELMSSRMQGQGNNSGKAMFRHRKQASLELCHEF